MGGIGDINDVTNYDINHDAIDANASQVLSSCPAAEQRLLRGKALECVSLVGSTVDKERSVGLTA